MDNSDTFNQLFNAPGSTRGWLTLGEQAVTMSGLSHGLTTLIRINRVPGFGLVGTFHEEGGKHWSGRGMQGSHTASTWTALLMVDDRTLNGLDFRYVQLTSTPAPPNGSARYERHSANVRTLINWEITK